MFGLGFFEILFILGMALIVIGPKQLPQVARTLGRFLTELRRSTSVIGEEMKHSMRSPPPQTPPAQEPTSHVAEEKDKGSSDHA
jgi:Tat protein translocase TatB subunit